MVTSRTNGLSGDLAVKAPVRVATTANIILEGEQVIDGVTCGDGTRVLVKNQTDTKENAVYVVSTGIWVRDLDFNGNNDVVDGTIILVREGTANINTFWALSCADDVVVIGESDIGFTRITPNLETILSSLAENDLLLYSSADSGFVNKSIAQFSALLGIKLNNDSATVDPVAGDDSADGYEVGSRWTNIATDTVFFCSNNSVGAAVWNESALTIADLGAAAVKGVVTSISGSPGDDNVPTEKAVDDLVNDTMGKLFKITYTLPETSDHGGGIGNGAWRAIVFNTVEVNEIDGCDLIKDMPYDSQASDFIVGEVITGQTSGATAKIVIDTDNGTDGTLGLTTISGTFADNEIIQGATSGSSLANIPSGLLDTAKFVVATGTYDFDFVSLFYGTNESKGLLYNITDGATEKVTCPCYARYSAEVRGHKRITLYSEKIFEYRGRVQTSQSVHGLGYGIENWGGDVDFEWRSITVRKKG